MLHQIQVQQQLYQNQWSRFLQQQTQDALHNLEQAAQGEDTGSPTVEPKHSQKSKKSAVGNKVSENGKKSRRDDVDSAPKRAATAADRASMAAAAPRKII